jgi:chemotaxis protein methyltransferase CheR
MSDGLAGVAALVRRRTGIALSEQHLPGLVAALSRAAPGMGAEQLLAEMERPGGEPLVGRVIDEVTVKETYFFRELAALEAVDWRRGLEAARARGDQLVRVWVSACATGEEAYSLAILACEALGVTAPPVSIVATDISAEALARAAAGRYSERAVQNLSPGLRERYFVREGPRYVLRPSVRSLVRLQQHNLIGDPVPPLGEAPFDVVACRNVLIYFDGPTIERVIAALESAVAAGGTLILGSADRLSGTAGRLRRRAVTPAPEAARRAHPPAPALRRPLGLERPPSPGPAAPGVPGRRGPGRIEEALRAADGGDLAATIAITGAILADEPLSADAHYVRGLAELGTGGAAAAVGSFRRALYLDPSFGLAAFGLGRANDAMGDAPAARRAFARALAALDPEDERHSAILGQVDLADVADACRSRLTADGSRPAG